MDDISEEPERLTHHVKYALLKNEILRKGEHMKKMKVIERDHVRKADEIWHDRNQAVRDHVMIGIYANRPKSNNLRSGSRLSSARDRTAMAEIEAISSLYLARGLHQKRSRRQNRISPPSTSLVTITDLASASTTSSVDSPAQTNTLERKLVTRLAERDEAILAMSRRRSTSESAVFTFNDLEMPTIPDALRKNSESNEQNLSNTGDVRPATVSITRPIRPASSRSTISAKALLCLQQSQQKNRTKPDFSRYVARRLRRSSSVPPPECSADVSERRNSRVSLPRRTSITASYKLDDSSATCSNATGNNSDANAEITERIHGFCTKIEAASEWKKYNTKWSIVKDFVQSLKQDKSDSPSPPPVDIINTNAPEGGGRKQSVWWCSTLETYDKSNKNNIE